MKTEYQESNKYHNFKLHPLNRELNMAKLRKLIASMRKHGYIKAYPLNVYVDKDYYVIKDGHHRFVAAKTLGASFCFVVTDDSATIQEINGPVGQWTTKNYFNSFINQGYEDYIFVKKFMDETDFSLTVAVPLLANQIGSSLNNLSEKIQDGRFKVALNTTYAGTISYITNFLKSIGVPFYNKNDFVTALSKVMWVKEFDAEKFIKHAKKNKSYFKPQSTADEYIRLIEKIYNTNNPSQLPLAFMTKQVMKKRNATAKKD